MNDERRMDRLCQEVYSLRDSSDAVLRWPGGMDAGEFALFNDWVLLNLRKIERQVRKSGQAKVPLQAEAI